MSPYGEAGAAAPAAALAPILDAHARWVARAPGGVQADLRQWSLQDADLSGCVLTEAVMRDINLSGAALIRANLVRADLRFASLRCADLRGADLSGALLDGASLAGANLVGAVLKGASLVETRLDDVRMSWFDHTLLAERLWRAAGGDLELRMLAAFIGRTTNRCWIDHGELPPRYRHWVLQQFLAWRRDGDEAPELLTRLRLPGGNGADPGAA